MSEPTRFAPGGVTNVKKNQPLGNYNNVDPTLEYKFFDDFTLFNASDGWSILVVGAGSSVSLGSTNPYGAVVLQTDANVNDGAGLNTSESFTLVETKKFFFKTKIDFSNIATSGVALGLISPNFIFPNDGIFFSNSGTALSLGITQGSSTVSFPLTDPIANNTFYELSLSYDGINTLSVFIDDSLITKITTTQAAFPFNTPLSLGALLATTDTSAKTSNIDYFFTSLER